MAVADNMAGAGPLGLDIGLAGIVKHWGDARAVDGINLTVPAGSFTALLGPSGCGKSTTLRIIAGLEYPDAGQVRIGGRDVTGQPPAARNLSMVFQSYALFPHLSVAENMVFGLKVRGAERAERDCRLKQVADLLELGALLQRRPGQLSGGQQQRVALGRAIIARRPVCLMDEPLSNLDARLRQEMRTEIRGLQQRLGFTMVYVTHDQVEAITMADQVALLNGGRIEQVADPRTLYDRPETVFAARFVGTPPMNLLHPAALGPPGDSAAAANLLVGLRPEMLFPDTNGALAAQVQSVEFHGAETLLTCRTAAGPDTSAETGAETNATVLVRTSGAVAPPVGAEMRFGFAPGDIHFFDRESGLRVSDDRNLAAHLAAGPPG